MRMIAGRGKMSKIVGGLAESCAYALLSARFIAEHEAMLPFIVRCDLRGLFAYPAARGNPAYPVLS